MRKVTILDTSLASKNIGDKIIVDSVKNELNNIFKEKTMFFNVPTHEIISRHSRRIINNSDYSIVSGTNLLSSKFNILKANQWNINLYDALELNDIILMGVGWSNYQENASLLTKLVYKKILNSNLLHSVRDNYTKNKLNKLGIENVVNTSCPTMWRFTPEFCSLIPKNKAKNVIFTLTDYRINEKKDKELIKILYKNYNKVFFWPQGSKDLNYFKKLNCLDDKINIINPTLECYDQILDSNISLDYIGTRLHGGIRAMQKKIRTIIIGIDNRAIEKEKDFNINVLKRKHMNKLENYITNDLETKIKLDYSNINRWKNQFKN